MKEMGKWNTVLMDMSISYVHSFRSESGTTVNLTFTNNILSIVIRYDSTTGTFTVPPGGDGFYYLSTYLVVDDGENGRFDIQLNEETICTAFADQIDTVNNDENTSCHAVAYITEGANLICIRFLNKITFFLDFGLCILFFHIMFLCCLN